MKHVAPIILLLGLAKATDVFTINFISSYVKNERRPTEVNYNFLGWPKSDVLKLIKVLSLSSTMSSSRCDTSPTTLFLADLRFSNLSILKNATKYLCAPYRWLMLDDGSSRIPRELPLRVDCDLVVAVRVGEGFHLTELYKTSLGAPITSQKRGYYDGMMVDVRPRREMYRRRDNLQGARVVMSNVIQESNGSKQYFDIESRRYKYDLVSRVSWYITRLALEVLNATPEYVFSCSHGVRGDGGWTGMMGDLVAGRADLGTSCALDKDKLEVVSFTDSIVPVRAKFIFRQPPLSYITNIYILVFTINTWIAIILCSVIATVAVYLESKWEASNSKSVSQLDGNISDALFLTVSAVSQQGCATGSSTLSGRIISWVTFAYMMMIYAAYSANTFVLLQAPSTAIRTLEHLANSKMTLAAVDSDYNRYALKEANEPIRKEIFKKITAEKGKEHFYELDLCVNNMKQTLFAFHGILEPVYRRIDSTFLESEKCQLMEVDYIMGFDHHVPVHKDSPYLELLRVSLKRVREAGITSALQKRHLAQRPSCVDKGASFSNIGVQNVRPVLLLLALGVAASLLILIIEIIVYKMTALRRSKSYFNTFKREKNNEVK